MAQTDHTFARLNTDDDDTVRPTSDFTAAMNITLEPGAAAARQGNVIVPYALPTAGVTRGLGGFRDGATNTAIHLLYNSSGYHRIVRYDPSDNSATTLLEWEGLHLSSSLVPQGGILDGLLVFLDGNDEVRSVNIKRAMAGEYTSTLLAADPYALHILKRPSFDMLTPYRFFGDSNKSNQIAFKSFQFAVRYVYKGGGRSVMSSHSLIVNPSVGPEAGLDLQNNIFIPLLALPKSPDLIAIEVMVREGASAVWNVAGRVEPDPSGSWSPVFVFSGATTGESIAADEAIKTFESLWPAKSLVIGHSCLFVGRITEGYDKGVPTSFAASLLVQAEYVAATSLSPVRTFHELSSYRFGIQFYDDFRRPGGVVSSMTVTIPAQPASAHSTLTQNIVPTGYTSKAVAWTLNNDNPLEIPAWATYYSICATANSRCTAFLQRMGVIVAGYYGDEADGTPMVYGLEDGHESEEKAFFVLIDTDTTLARTGGYIFQAGDVLRFMDEPGQEWPILYTKSSRLRQRNGNAYTQGGFLWAAIGRRVASVTDANKTHFINFLGRIEIYSPSKISDVGGLMYEQTGLMPITTSIVSAAVQKKYSITAGTIQGDTFLVRSNYLTGPSTDATLGPMESPTALAPLNGALATWLDVRRGVPAFVLTPSLGQAQRNSLIRFSRVKVQGTQINGLGQWDALSQYDKLPQEQGAIIRMLIADQAQVDGTIMLVTQERGAATLQLGRSQITTADGKDLLTISNNVLGAGSTLRGGFGCIDPGSALEAAGKVFYFCRERVELLRYDRNGNVALAETYKGRRRLRTVAAANTNSVVVGCYEPRRKEYWLTFLPIDTTQSPTTLVFCDRPGHEGWVDACSAYPTAGLAVGDELVTWQDGQMWRHTENASVGTFYGKFTPSTITFIACLPGARLTKVWRIISIHSHTRWTPTRLANTDGQMSRILPSWLKYSGNIWRAALRRDEQSPGPDSPAIKLHGGNELQSMALEVTLTADAGVSARITACDVGFIIPTGQPHSS